MTLTRMVLAGLLSLIPIAVFAQSCDEETLAADISARYLPQLEAADGICATTRIYIEMLEDSKSAFSQCLHGKTLQDTIDSLDAAIAQSMQTISDAC